MALTPLDIHNKEFRKGFRGYLEEEVDEFLDEVVKEFELLIKENVRLQDEAEKMKSQVEQYRQLEQTLQNTLVVAQATAEEVKAAAKKEAELLLKEAEINADKIIEAAHAKVRELVGQNEEIRRQTQIMKTRLRTLLQAQMEMLDSVGEGKEGLQA